MANPTSNFGWQMPTPTDLVTDLPADFEVFGQAVDSSLADLKGGTTGQVLAKNSGTDMDFIWVAQDDSNAIQNAIVDAKGDLIGATAADTPARLAVGTDFAFLKADSSTSTGLAWDNAAYTSYTPVLSAVSGTFTTASVTGTYKRIGKLCHVKFAVDITTNGTASVLILVTPPFTAAGYATGTWREVLSVGNSGQTFLSGSTQIGVANFDNSYCGANSRVFQGTLVYEVA
jgi:hypothetical protein